MPDIERFACYRTDKGCVLMMIEIQFFLKVMICLTKQLTDNNKLTVG